MHLHSRLLCLSMSVYGLHSQQFLNFWFTYSAVLYVQGSKKKKNSLVELKSLKLEFFEKLREKNFPSGTRVFETRVLLGKFFPLNALFRPRVYKNRALRKKNFPSRTRVFETRVLLEKFFPLNALFRPRAYKNRAFGEKKNSQ